MYFLDSGVSLVLFYASQSRFIHAPGETLVWVMDVTEFTLRAPSLFGAAAYLIATYLLCAELFGYGLQARYPLANQCKPLGPSIT